MKELQGRVALVTGAARGIGRSTALALARAGCDIIVSDLNAEALQPLATEIRALGRRALPVACNVARREEVEAMAQRAIAEMGRVDILVNNAGVAAGGLPEHIPLQDWEWCMDVNLWAHIHTVQALLPHMLQRGTGHLVHVVSAGGLLSIPAILPYSVSKFAALGLAEGLAAHLRPKGIGVTAVCPLLVNTQILTTARITLGPPGAPGAPPRDSQVRQRVERFYQKKGITPDVIGEKIVGAIRRNQFLVLIPRWYRILFVLKTLCPNSPPRIAAMMSRRLEELMEERPGKSP